MKNEIIKLKNSMEIGEKGLIAVDFGLYSELIVFERDSSEKGATCIRKDSGIGDINEAIGDLKKLFGIEKILRIRI